MYSNAGPLGPGVLDTGPAVSRNTAAFDTLYFKFTAETYSDFNDEDYLAGFTLVHVQGGEDYYHLAVGNAFQSDAYSAYFKPNNIDPPIEVDLNSSTPEPSATYQLVRDTDVTTIAFKVKFNPSGVDNVTVWLNPDPTKSEALQPTSLTTTFNADATFEKIYLWQYYFPTPVPDWIYRDLLVATTAGDLGTFASSVVYSGTNGETLWSPASSLDPPAVGLKGKSASPWDDLRLGCSAIEVPGVENSYSCAKRLEADGNRVELATSGSGLVKRFSAGETIDGGESWSGDTGQVLSRYEEEIDPPSILDEGEFRDTNVVGYAGVRMTQGADVYYGWVRLSVDDYDNANVSVTLHDWAFRDFPGVAIAAGEIPDPTDTDLDGVLDWNDNCPQLANPDQADTDVSGPDRVGDACDNCPTVQNGPPQSGIASVGNQADGDVAWTANQVLELSRPLSPDGVGDACDNCLGEVNLRQDASYLVTNPWATLTGGQRDDDHDGIGNKCDAKFVGTPSQSVGGFDLGQFRASATKDRSYDTCGTVGTRPCAIFDLDESFAGNAIGGLDLARFRILAAKPPGPTCPTCTGTGSLTLPCTAGTAGSCDP